MDLIETNNAHWKPTTMQIATTVTLTPTAGATDRFLNTKFYQATTMLETVIADRKSKGYPIPWDEPMRKMISDTNRALCFARLAYCLDRYMTIVEAWQMPTGHVLDNTESLADFNYALVAMRNGLTSDELPSIPQKTEVLVRLLEETIAETDRKLDAPLRYTGSRR